MYAYDTSNTEYCQGDVIISETPGGRMIVYLIDEIRIDSWMGQTTAFLTVIDSRFDDELGTTQAMDVHTLKTLYTAVKWQDFVDSLSLGSPKTCSCETFNLVHFGCKCGAIEQERVLGNQ